MGFTTPAEAQQAILTALNNFHRASDGKLFEPVQKWSQILFFCIEMYVAYVLIGKARDQIPARWIQKIPRIFLSDIGEQNERWKNNDTSF